MGQAKFPFKSQNASLHSLLLIRVASSLHGFCWWNSIRNRQVKVVYFCLWKYHHWYVLLAIEQIIGWSQRPSPWMHPAHLCQVVKHPKQWLSLLWHMLVLNFLYFKVTWLKPQFYQLLHCVLVIWQHVHRLCGLLCGCVVLHITISITQKSTYLFSFFWWSSRKGQ